MSAEKKKKINPEFRLGSFKFSHPELLHRGRRVVFT